MHSRKGAVGSKSPMLSTHITELQTVCQADALSGLSCSQQSHHASMPSASFSKYGSTRLRSARSISASSRMHLSAESASFENRTCWKNGMTSSCSYNMRFSKLVAGSVEVD